MTDEAVPETTEAADDATTEDSIRTISQALALAEMMRATMATIFGRSPMTSDRVLACAFLAVQLTQQAEEEKGLRMDWEDAVRASFEDVIRLAKVMGEHGKTIASLTQPEE